MSSQEIPCEIAYGHRSQSVRDVVLSEKRQDEIRVTPRMTHGERAASKSEISNVLSFKGRLPNSTPYVTTFPENFSAMARTRESSLLRYATRGSTRPSRSSALASAIPSIESKNSRWTGLTLVITPSLGSAIEASFRISPFADIPISSTAMV